ncbi:hypothetical protein GCM10010233_59970 [Streptomyces pseudogriseolus]|nr:hypothetical protein GCM10010233_59970 [Streptomyces gancidicus]
MARVPARVRCAARAALRDHSVNARVPPAPRDKPGRRQGGRGHDLQDLPREGRAGVFPGRGGAVYSPKLAVLIK